MSKYIEYLKDTINQLDPVGICRMLYPAKADTNSSQDSKR